jgi:hypothetical protein
MKLPIEERPQFLYHSCICLSTLLESILNSELDIADKTKFGEIISESFNVCQKEYNNIPLSEIKELKYITNTCKVNFKNN